MKQNYETIVTIILSWLHPWVKPKSIAKILFIWPSILISLEGATAIGADAISQAMCRDNVSFQSCYGMSKDECLDWADVATKDCLKRFPPQPAPPQSINQLATSELGKWNVLLGHCSEAVFEETHKDRASSDAKCMSLLKERQSYRLKDSAFPTRQVRHSGSNLLEAMALPFLIGLSFSAFFLFFRSRKKRISWLVGFLSWVLFIGGAFIGELASHFIFPQFYEGLGDNPSQVGGMILVFIVSIAFNPILWIWFRSFSPKKD